jgi:ABC-type antimicrobial peptide transport system permease subunit
VVAVGIGVGLVGAWYLAQLAQSLLFEVEPRDPLVFAAATVTIAMVGLLAAVVPARRAARVEPMEALRQE